MRLLCVIVMSIAAGLLLGMSLFIYAAHRLRISPWFYPPRWFFSVLTILLIGIVVETWIAVLRRRRANKEDDDDR